MDACVFTSLPTPYILHRIALDARLKSTRAPHKTPLTLISGSSGAQAKQRLDQGFDMVSLITDVGLVAAGFQREMAAVKGEDGSKAKGGY